MSLKSQILTAMRAQLTRNRAIVARWPSDWILGTSREERIRGLTLQSDSRDGIVEYDVRAWLGHVPSTSERRAVSRAVAQLNLDGHLVQMKAGDLERCVAVKLLDRECQSGITGGMSCLSSVEGSLPKDSFGNASELPAKNSVAKRPSAAPSTADANLTTNTGKAGRK